MVNRFRETFQPYIPIPEYTSPISHRFAPYIIGDTNMHARGSCQEYHLLTYIPLTYIYPTCIHIARLYTYRINLRLPWHAADEVATHSITYWQLTQGTTYSIQLRLYVSIYNPSLHTLGYYKCAPSSHLLFNVTVTPLRSRIPLSAHLLASLGLLGEEDSGLLLERLLSLMVSHDAKYLVQKKAEAHTPCPVSYTLDKRARG